MDLAALSLSELREQLRTRAASPVEGRGMNVKVEPTLAKTSRNPYTRETGALS